MIFQLNSKINYLFLVVFSWIRHCFSIYPSLTPACAPSPNNIHAKQWGWDRRPAYRASRPRAVAKWGEGATKYGHSRTGILPVPHWLPGSHICLQVVWHCPIYSHPDWSFTKFLFIFRWTNLCLVSTSLCVQVPSILGQPTWGISEQLFFISMQCIHICFLLS